MFSSQVKKLAHSSYLQHLLSTPSSTGPYFVSTFAFSEYPNLVNNPQVVRLNVTVLFYNLLSFLLKTITNRKFNLFSSFVFVEYKLINLKYFTEVFSSLLWLRVFKFNQLYKPQFHFEELFTHEYNIFMQIKHNIKFGCEDKTLKMYTMCNISITNYN